MPRGIYIHKKGFCTNTGRTHFNKGHIPWSKLHPELCKSNSGSFKKGQVSPRKGVKLSNKLKEKLRQIKLGKYNGKNHPQWKGGSIKNSSNYILIYKPNHPFSNKIGYIFEHRFVMEQMLKRYLTSKEVVHHINSIKDDNRKENLQLFPNRNKHTKFHFSSP